MVAQTDSDSKKVMNLCVAYKFLLHNHLIQTCFDNSKMLAFDNTEETKSFKFSNSASIVSTK